MKIQHTELDHFKQTSCPVLRGGCEESMSVHTQPADSFIIVPFIRVRAQQGHPNMIIFKREPVPSAMNDNVDGGP